MSLITDLAARAHRVAGGEVSDHGLRAVQVHLADAVGALAAGHATLAPDVARLLDGSCSPTSVTGMRGAAFAAGAYAYCWETTDLHRPTVLCPAAVVVPAALGALTVRPEATWRQFLLAIAAGFEVALAAGLATNSARLLAQGWWPTGHVAPLGGAAAVSVLWGCPQDTTASAIALAAQQAGGMVAGETASANGRYLLAAAAAERSVTAAVTAEAGWRGPLDVLEDPRSPLRAGGLPPADLLLPGISLKLHSCAQHLQAAVDAVLEVREAVGPLEQVAELECLLPAQLVPVVDRPAPFHTALSVLASAQFVLAVALLRGAVNPAAYSEEVRTDPRVLDLASRVRVGVDDELTAAYPGCWGARVRVRHAGGTVTSHRAEAAGDPGQPLPVDRLRAKFLDLGTATWGDARCAELADVLFGALPTGPAQPLLDFVLPLLTSSAPVLEEVPCH